MLLQLLVTLSKRKWLELFRMCFLDYFFSFVCSWIGQWKKKKKTLTNKSLKCLLKTETRSHLPPTNQPYTLQSYHKEQELENGLSASNCYSLDQLCKQYDFIWTSITQNLHREHTKIINRRNEFLSYMHKSIQYVRDKLKKK